MAGPVSQRLCPICRAEFPAGAKFCPHDGQRLTDGEPATHADPLLGTVFDGRYRIESRLGVGGMGVVYAARHCIIDKRVAIKVLRREFSENRGLVERFMREAKAASRIGHPNIVDVTDFGRLDDGHIYYVMEFLHGHTLAQEIRQHHSAPGEHMLNLALQICHGLSAAHEQGIVHRDLKPENIFVVNPSRGQPTALDGGVEQNLVKLLDFGIAKISWSKGTRLTQVGSIFGTPQYMSPEQASGRDSDHRGDVYALGCIVYEMCTQEVPFLSDTFMGTLTKHMFEAPLPPRQLRPDLNISPRLEHVILTALAKDPDKRYQSMKEVAAALRECTAEAGAQLASPPADVGAKPSEQPAAASSPDTPLRRLPKRVWALTVAIALAVTLAAGLWIAGSTTRSTQQAASVAVDAGRKAVVRRLGLRPDAGAPPNDAALPRGVLWVESLPSGATVVLDGDAVGKTPLRLRVVPNEKIVVRVRKDGYRTATRAFQPTADKATVTVRLRRRSRARRPAVDAALGPDELKASDLRRPRRWD